MTRHPEVYPPSEDTDLLIRVLREREGQAPPHGWWCEVGTGSGAVAQAMKDLGARVVATDVNPHAALLVRADLLTALKGPFDVVAFNSPYLPSAEHERVAGWLDRAFHGGDEGVEVSERFVLDLPRVLAPGGRAYLVVSSRANLDRLAVAVARAGLRWEKVGSERFFFEEIAVWRLVRAA